MDGGQITAIIIVAIVMVASILRAKVRGPYRRSHSVDDSQALQENARLHDEVSQLKERLKVLERITVDKENSLSREIESLRDRG
jgi:dynactin complex subunit